MENIKIFKTREIPAIIALTLIFLICIGLIIVLITGWEIDEPGEIYAVIGLLLFYFIFVLIIFFSLGRKLVLSKLSITEKKRFKKDIVLSYNEIEKAVVILSKNMILLKGNNKKIKLKGIIKGIDEAVNIIMNRIGQEKISFRE
jgi:hypothetical protein